MKSANLKCKTQANLKTKAPFGWVGGKSILAKEIIELMPEHKLYCEVFGGGLNVFYQKEPSKIEVLNDINSDLINLHKVIQRYPESLAVELSKMLRSREMFFLIKNKELVGRNNIQRAAFYYYQITLSFGSKMQNFAMPKSRVAKNIYRSFDKQSKRLKNAVIENLSYDKLTKNYDSKETLFYLDPPYVGTESYYEAGFSEENHRELAKILSSISGKFILSYNDCKLVRALYKDFNIKEVKTRYSLNGANNKKAVTELVILNL